MDIETALKYMRNLGVALNDSDSDALDTLCDFVEKAMSRPLSDVVSVPSVTDEPLGYLDGTETERALR
jgi:hypothetical protein